MMPLLTTPLLTTLHQLADLLDADLSCPFTTDSLKIRSTTPLIGDSISDLEAIAQSPVHRITTDSRQVQPGDVFLALTGETFDGHDFVAQALNQGAIAAIVARSQLASLRSNPALTGALIPVPDPLAAYQAIATWWRHQCQPTVVAVTGSVGKTTTKEMIAAVLSHHGRVLKTRANFNNEIGVPKTLLELEPTHDYAVIEMGMRASGEIALLTQVAQPDVAVITNVGTAHIGRLGSEAAIAQAKCELLGNLHPSGIAILNADNARLMDTAHQVWSGKIITFGLTGGDVQGTVVDGDVLLVAGRRLPLPLPGAHNALNYLAAIAVAQALGLDESGLEQGIALDLPSGRAQRYALPNDIVVLDETYNAGVESMTAALHMLAAVPGTRHIAVLGTMKELGDRSVDLHTRVGQVVQHLQLDHLLILADPAEQEALQRGAADVPSEAFADPESLGQRLLALVEPGDRILFKASRSVALDRVVAAFHTALAKS